jgi:histidinol dehydrogenase
MYPPELGATTMTTIRTIHADQTDAAAELRQLRESLLLDKLILDETPQSRTVQEIIREVRQRGDEAVSEITARVDEVHVPPDDIRVPDEKLREAHDHLQGDLHQAIRHAIASVRLFQESVMSPPPKPLNVDGKRLEIRPRPLRRIGVCVPGAAAPLPSSAIHCAVPAQVAGVKEIVLVAPPRHEGDIHPTILATAHELGITEVYRMGGAQAVAAMAIGTERIRKVDKIVGPGGVYGQLAKRALYGVTDIDMFAGPSEIVIIADHTATASYVAADMLGQAEHDPGCSILLTDQPDLAEAVKAELDKQLPQLSREEGTRRCLEAYSAVVVVSNLGEAARLADEIAPEHLEISTAHPREVADQIDSAGAIFLGHHTPEAAGDYVAGPSHVLPTGGTARFLSGVSALGFLRYSSILEYSSSGLVHDAGAIECMAMAEGLDAHAKSVEIRTRR